MTDEDPIPSRRELPSRSNRGSRMSMLVQEEELQMQQKGQHAQLFMNKKAEEMTEKEADEAFWNQDFFRDDDIDDEFNEIGQQEDEDVVDSDFDMSENEDENDKDQEIAEKEIEAEEKKSRKKKSVYVDKALKKKQDEKKKAKAAAKKAITPKKRKLSETNIVTDNAAGEEPKTPTTSIEKRSTRDSTKKKSEEVRFLINNIVNICNRCRNV